MKHVAGVIFAVAAFLLVFFCIPETGIIYTHDTQSYEYAASTLLETGTMKYFGYDTPIIQWPPLYIVALAVFKLLGVSVTKGAALLNAGLFALIVYISFLYLFDNMKVKLLSVPAVILLTVSVPFVYISGYGWTEMLFIFLSVLSMILMVMYIKRKEPFWFISCAVASALCWLTRYIGIAIIAALAIVLFISEKTFRNKFRLTFSYGVFSCVPMVLWVVRNLFLSGTFTGGRQPGEYTLKDNIRLSLSVFMEWFSSSIPEIAYISILFFLLLIILAIPLKKNGKESIESATDLLAGFLITLIYSSLLLFSATKAAMDPINSRLWSPVYPFIIFTMAFLMDMMLRNIESRNTKKFLAVGFMVFALIFTVNPMMWILEKGFPRKHALLGIRESLDIKNSPVLALARETIEPSEGTLVISNDASILTMHTDFKCYYPPKKTGIPIYTFGSYKDRISDYDKIYLVWSGPPESKSFMDVPQFDEIYNMEKIAQNNYCTIYRLK